MADRLFSNGAIHTFDGPPHRSLLVRAGRIAAFDTTADAEVVDLGGRTLIPAFVDAHLHLFSLIDRAAGIDCRGMTSVVELRRRIREAPGTGWIRASGYDQATLGRLTRADLDVTDRPVRLLERTNHLAVVNSAGLRLMPEPVIIEGAANGFMELDEEKAFNGVLWEPGQWFSNRALPPLQEDEVAGGIERVVATLHRAGIAAVHDASPANDRPRWDLVRRLRLALRITLLPGERFAAAFDGVEDDPLLMRGPVKLMLPDRAGDLPPLADLVDRMRAVGSVALHAVIHQAVRLAVEAARQVDVPVRLEHAAEWPPDLIPPPNVSVVLHPIWVRERAHRYRASVEQAVQPWLHRGRFFRDAGIPFRFASDAPTGTIDPLGAITTAVTRRDAAGSLFNPDEAIGMTDAFRASCLPLTIGAPADLVVLDRDPFTVSPDEIANLRVESLWVNGEAVHER